MYRRASRETRRVFLHTGTSSGGGGSGGGSDASAVQTPPPPPGWSLLKVSGDDTALALGLAEFGGRAGTQTNVVALCRGATRALKGGARGEGGVSTNSDYHVFRIKIRASGTAGRD